MYAAMYKGRRFSFSQRQKNRLPLSFSFVTVATMVLLACLWKAFVASAAVAPLVTGHPSKPAFPSLLDATASELTAGLDNGSFSSIDLVNVSVKIPLH